MQESQHLLYVGFVVLSTIFYGFNVNMVAGSLLTVSSLHIAAVALSLNAVPALLALIFTGYFNLPLGDADTLSATGAASLMGIVETTIAYHIILHAGKKSR